MELRDYQAEARDLALKMAGAYPGAEPGRTVIVAPTGAGKTVIATGIAEEYNRLNPGKRILFLAHRTELVEQAAEKLRSRFGAYRVGIVKAQWNQPDRMIVVASVQTVQNERRLNSIKNVGLVIIDECHHSTSPSWRKVIGHFGGHGASVIGMTATPVRADGVGLDEVFTDICYQIKITTLIREGWLVNPVGLRVEVPRLDLNAVHRRGTDYDEHELADALAESFAPDLVAAKCLEHAPDRSTLLFAPTVESAGDFADALTAAGITAEPVWGAMAGHDRKRVLKALHSGKLQAVTNCAVLTEGFDAPRISNLIIARPTQSEGLFRQMVGRGLRAHSGKTDCIVMDVVGATKTNSIIGLGTLLGRSPKPRQTQTGETLLDIEAEESALADAEASGAMLDEASAYRGPVDVIRVDMLGKSDWAWQRTAAGHLALTADDAIFSVIEYRGTWGVVKFPTAGPQAEWVGWNIPSLEEAVELTESLMSAMPSFAKRKAAWRRSDPSLKMVSMARFVGVEVEPGMKAGEVSDRINTAKASKRIDPLIAHWTRET